MRVFYMANNLVGWRVAEFLRSQDTTVVGLALHPQPERRYGEEIRCSLKCDERSIFDAAALHEPEQLDRIRALKPDIGVSVFFGHILKPCLLDIFPHGVVNLHPSFLPFNRGANPNVWNIVDGSPAGVTLHYIDSGIDTGDIIAQERVSVDVTDTGATLYRKLEQTSVVLFQRAWPALCTGTGERYQQPAATGTTRRRRDLAELDRICLDRDYTARELIDAIRARTFAPYPGTYFETDDGNRVYLRLQLLTAAELEAAGD